MGKKQIGDASTRSGRHLFTRQAVEELLGVEKHNVETLGLGQGPCTKGDFNHQGLLGWGGEGVGGRNPMTS